MHFTFGSPYALLLLLLLPCFIWCRASSEHYYFTKLAWLSRERLLIAWQPWLKMLLFALMVVALAKPFVYESSSNFHKKGRDLMLVLDASGSMAQSGYDSKHRMKNKYQVNLELASDFIDKRHDDNMGVVIFGTFAYTASPLTYDLQALKQLLQMTNVGIAGESTALGDALMRAIEALSYGQAQNRAIILLTDGYHNAGKHSPKEAVQKATLQQIKIYTIGIGNASAYDAALLQQIAKESGAKSYAADSAEALKKIYEEINQLEPSAIRSEHYLNQRLLVLLPLLIVFVVLLAWVLWEHKEEQTA